MKARQEILTALSEDKEIQKRIKQLGNLGAEFIMETIYRDVLRYILACKECRLLATYPSNNHSVIKLVELSNKNILHFNCMIFSYGFNVDLENQKIRIGKFIGVEDFHRSLIYKFFNLGFFDVQEREFLLQNKPNII